MKKMFISVVALAMGVMVMATETAYVQIKLTGETGGANSVFLTEDDAYTNAFEPGVDVEKMMSQSNSKSVLMYGFVGSTPCEDVVAANLDGLCLGFTTNQVDQNYTLSFIDYEGSKTLTLYDRVTKTQTVITDGGSYNFSVTAAEVGRVAVNDRFVIGLPSYSVTMNAYGWASFSSYDDLAIADGLTAYKGAYAGEVLNLNEVNYIKANEGVILYGTAGQTYELNLGNGSSDFAGNNLKPASAWENHSGTVYVLHDEALYQYTGANFPANKAYLEIPVSSNGAPRRISFRFNGTTALENAELNEAKAVKFVENGQVFIRRGNEVFNLQGQIVK